MVELHKSAEVWQPNSGTKVLIFCRI
jgi:hypothetical protein